MLMPETNKKDSLDWTKIFLGIILTICALTLALTAINLRPVAKWANYQSMCIEQEIKKAPIEWAVRKCNGRSKVYQVK